MKKRFVPLVIPALAISMVGAVSTFDKYIGSGPPWFREYKCPYLIRKINLTGVDNKLRGDLSDAVQPYKLKELSEANIGLMIDSIRRVYQANCMLDRLSEIRFRMRRDELFIEIKEIRFPPEY